MGGYYVYTAMGEIPEINTFLSSIHSFINPPVLLGGSLYTKRSRLEFITQPTTKMSSELEFHDLRQQSIVFYAYLPGQRTLKMTF